MRNTTWQQFERLTVEIQRELSPEATVAHNQRLTGRSGISIQCDAVLRARVGELAFDCLIECKDHDDPVGPGIVREVLAKTIDLGFHHAILVSAAGFTDDAVKVAEAYQISAYRLIETEHVRWAHEALLPICFVRAVIDSSEFRFLGADDQVITPAAAKTRAGMSIEMPLWDTKMKTYVSLRQALEHLWDVALDIGQIGENSPEISSDSCRYLLHNSNGVSVPVTLAAKFRPKITYHYNVISLNAFRGFFDESSREILPTKYETGVLDVDTVIKTWPSVSSKDDVPFVPVDHLLMLGFIHRKPRTPKRFTLGRTFGPAPEGTIPL